MKRLLASLGLVVVPALLPAQAASADILNLTAGVFPDEQLTALNSSGDPFAVGGGTDSFGAHFAFSAHCKSANVCGPGAPPGSATASGYAVVSDPALGDAQGHVCGVFAFGNEAGFSIVVEKGSGTFGGFTHVRFVVDDNGNPASGGLPDRLQVGPGFGCQEFSFGHTSPVAQGNIVVKSG